MQSQDMQWLLKEKYDGQKTEAFFADSKRLALGEPLAYLIGWTPFLNCKIWLDAKPLIPRPETEYWVEIAIKTITGSKTMSLGIDSEPLRILDLCSGSGCIGTAVAKAIPETRVDFSEIDARLLPTIKKNISENLTTPEKYSIFHSNLFKGLSGKYDFILSNPPYIDETLNRTDKSVKDNEPYVALFGGKDGLEIITQIIETAPQHLVSGGQLWIEHEPEQSAAITETCKKHGFGVSTEKDQYDIERFSILVLE